MNRTGPILLFSLFYVVAGLVYYLGEAVGLWPAL